MDANDFDVRGSRSTQDAVQDPASIARAHRDSLLTATDWMTLRAADTGIALSPAAKTYRQALRDLPTQPGFPATIVWPALPAT